MCTSDLDFTFLEMNPFTLVNGEPYPLDMRGELDDTAAFKNFKKYIFFPWTHCFFIFLISVKKCVTSNFLSHIVTLCRWGNIEFPLPFGRVLSATESFIHALDEKVI